MVAVVVTMAVMAIMLTVAVQTATFQKRREKEAELIFRGTQIIEALRLFQARNGRLPVRLIELVRARPRVIRKVWKDPITDKTDWVPIFLGQEGDVVGGAAGGAAGGAGRPGAPTPPAAVGGGTGPGGPRPATGAIGPVIGVHSRSCEESIKVYNGRTRYCDWKFVYMPKRGPGGLGWGDATGGGSPGKGGEE